MLTKSLIRVIRSLKIKKYRSEHGLFLAEGRKIVQEAINENQDISHIIGTREFHESLNNVPERIECIQITSKQVSSYSSLKSNEDGFALLKINNDKKPNLNITKWSIFLDSINDPGNLGTIIRTADWFGLKRIYCSLDTCDHYNPKAVMATMGSIFRVELIYCSLSIIIEENPDLRILGADLNGIPLSRESFNETQGLVVLGNEAQGISKEAGEHLTERITIEGSGKAESLNVAQSCAILMNELFKKGKFK